MTIYFDNSRPDRTKRARRMGRGLPELHASPIPPAKSYELVSIDELLIGDRTLIMDTECYPNYWLAAFKCVETNKIVYFEITPQGWTVNGIYCEPNYWIQWLGFVMHRFRIVGFNSKPYDLPMISLALFGVLPLQLKEYSNELIVEGKRPPYNLAIYNINHIDIIEVAPLTASLKAYAGRLHCERMQDLPYSYMTYLSYEEAVNVRDYCVNDLDNTQLLFEELVFYIELREELSKESGEDWRSKSDAQVAEALIRFELSKLGPIAKGRKWEPGDSFNCIFSDKIVFQTANLQSILETIKQAKFTLNEFKQPKCPDLKTFNFRLGICDYQMGLGGLHTQEESVSYYATEDTKLIDMDVTGFYPRIIINGKLSPQHLGDDFITVFGEKIIFRRELSKVEGNKKLADGLKIPANGTFGKYGDSYSDLLFAPDRLMEVTISGQLFLLMNIENVILNNFEIVSANTDGFVTKVPVSRYEEFMALCKMWEQQTGFMLEETKYKSIHSRDINNYIAVKEDGTCKTKGIYCERGSALNSVLSKNPETLILSDALQSYLSTNRPIRETILECRNLRRFVSVRTVKGGAEKDGIYLGKVIRWYYAKETNGEINYVLSGNKVPKSLGAKPCMILPKEFPDDIDYNWYIEEANQMLYDLGIKQRQQIGKLF